MKAPGGAAAIELPGPWTHRHITAGGASFHVADTGTAMDYALVLLHAFPEHWWSWRDVIPPLAGAGRRVVAMDIRGCGTSDLSRGASDLVQLAQDVIGVVRALGISSFSVAGAGTGGAVAWMVGALSPSELRSLIALGAPHPLGIRPVIGRAPWSGGRLLQGRLALPTGRARALRDGRLLDAVYRSWASPSSRERLDSQSGPFRAALARPFAPHTALRALRAARRPSREARRILRSPVAVPVLSIRGSDDGAWSPVDHAHDAAFVDAAHSCVVVREAGHFLPEEAPSQVARAITAHLDELSDTWDCD